MAVTKEDLRDFNRFAMEVVENVGADSLGDLVRQWEARSEVREITVGVEIDPDTAKWLGEAFPDVRDEQRLQQALARRGGVTTAEMLGKAVLAAARARRL